MRRMMVSTTLLAALVLTVFVTERSANSAPQAKSKAGKKGEGPAAATYGNAVSIADAEMKISLYFLASDQWQNRTLPSRGYDTAALYVASPLAEWGISSGGS